MLCVDCRQPAVKRRSRCRKCWYKHAKELKLLRQSETYYRPEDHAGKRARLRAMVQAAIRAGEIVTGDLA